MSALLLALVLTHILKPGIPIKQKHTAVEFSELLCVLCLLCTTLKFHMGKEHVASALSCAALNKLVCLPNKPCLAIRISSISPTRSGKQTKGCFQNLNFPISTPWASSAKNHIRNHRTHFYTEVAK